MQLQEFEELLQWFEKQDDPWFYEKRASKCRDLLVMQSKYCPCELSNMYSNINPFQQSNMTQIMCCMKRANIILPYSASDINFATDEENEIITKFPPVHIDDCACTDIKILSKKEKLLTIQRYKRFLLDEYKEI